MGLSSALATAMSGLRSTQAALSIISSNVANANTPGYVAQNPNQIEIASGGFGSTVMTTGVNRQLDLFVQNQLRTETSGGAYADQVANILTQLQTVYGTPGGSGTLETALNNFTTALQSLSNNPSNQSAQSVALSAAQGLAQQLNATTKGIQTLRSNVEQDIGQLGHPGQRGDLADRHAEYAAAGSEPIGSAVGDLAGPARQRDQHAGQICRYPRRLGRDQRHQRVHQFGRPAGRRGPELAIHLRLARDARRHLALQQRSDQERRSASSTSSCPTASRSTSSRTIS